MNTGHEPPKGAAVEEFNGVWVARETRTAPLVDTESVGNYRVPVSFIVQADTPEEAIAQVRNALIHQLGMFVGSEDDRERVLALG